MKVAFRDDEAEVEVVFESGFHSKYAFNVRTFIKEKEENEDGIINQISEKSEELNEHNQSLEKEQGPMVSNQKEGDPNPFDDSENRSPSNEKGNETKEKKNLH